MHGLLLIYRPLRDGRLSWSDGWLTHSYPRSGHLSSVDRAQVKKSPAAKDRLPNSEICRYQMRDKHTREVSKRVNNSYTAHRLARIGAYSQPGRYGTVKAEWKCGVLWWLLKAAGNLQSRTQVGGVSQWLSLTCVRSTFVGKLSPVGLQTNRLY